MVLAWGLAGCGAPPTLDVRVHYQDERGTGVVLRWEQDATARGAVRWTDPVSGAVRTTPARVGRAQRHLVLGLPPGEPQTLEVLLDGVPSATLDVVPRDAPEDLPAFAVVQGAWDGWTAVPWTDPVGARAGVVVLDGAARPLAWTASALFPTDVGWRWDPADGLTLVHNVMGETGALESVPLDEEIAPSSMVTPGGHHAFTILPDDGLAWLAYETRQVDGEAVIGDVIVVRDAAGNERVAWNSFDSLPVERHEAWDSLGAQKDWTHANALAWNPASRSWLVSLYWLREVVEIDDASGVALRVLDGHETSSTFGPQHAASFEDEGVLLFDNALQDRPSRVARFGWDGALQWEWTPQERTNTLVLGDAEGLADGRLLTAWGTSGKLIGLDADRAPTWEVHAPAGIVLGQVAWTAGAAD